MPDLEKTTKRPDAAGRFELTQLEDIDPEFVSLVPRGANKHSKMLVVKSDDPAAALAAFRKDADPAAPGTPAIYAHLVGAVLAAGLPHPYDASDALDALLPPALAGRLRKDDAGAPPPEAPPPAEPPFGAWLAQAREHAAVRLLEAVLASPAVVAPPVAKAAPAPDPAVEIAKAEAATLRAEVGRLRAAIGSSAALPAGEVAAVSTTPPGPTMVPWTVDFAAVAANQER